MNIVNMQKHQEMMKNIKDIKTIIDDAKKRKDKHALTLRNWLLGKTLVEKEFIKQFHQEGFYYLSHELMRVYGEGFQIEFLLNCIHFYKLFPQFSKDYALKKPLLSWPHYQLLLQVYDQKQRAWYEQKALIHQWDTRTLHWNILIDYYAQAHNRSPQREESVPSHLYDETINYESEENNLNILSAFLQNLND